MNCQDFENLVLALARGHLLADDHLMDATMREQARIHTERCLRCASRLAEERALIADVRSVIAELAGAEPSARVDAALLAAFRAQTTPMVTSTVIPIPMKVRHWFNWKFAASAAGILILISVIAIFWQTARSPKSLNEEHASLPTPASADSPHAPPLSPTTEPPINRDPIASQRPKKIRKSVSRQESVNSSDEAEVVTQFFSLREGEDLVALDGLQLMRVELPGSALSEFGLPVDPESANEPVKADVVLGQDGLARAIRFVR